MNLTWDPTKRTLILAERGLDFARTSEVFAGLGLDQRQDYGEPHAITFG